MVSGRHHQQLGEQQMKFEEAFKECKRIRRKSWIKDAYFSYTDSMLMVNDLLANDWEVIE